MIRLPNTNRNRPIFRILTMPEGTWNSQTWTALPIPLIISRSTGVSVIGTVGEGGYHVGSISRWCLPDEDRAEFYIDIGKINGSTVTALPLLNTAVRIQVMDDASAPNGWESVPTTGWRTVFAGTVIYNKHQHMPGNTDYGRVIYYCAGVLWRTRNWPLDRHSTDSVTHAKGHPGYNVPLHGWFRKVIGNKSTDTAVDPFSDLTPPFDTYYRKHSLPVDRTSTEKWTDNEVVQHALVSSRAKGEPLIQTDFSQGIFNGNYAWPVATGDTCWDLLRRVCDRRRGRGAVCLEYEDVTPDGQLNLTLKAYPSFKNTIEYKISTTDGSLTLDDDVQILGAETGKNAIDVDVNGDHRIGEMGFSYDDRQSSLYDTIVIQGERIQVLCNLNFFGSSLDKRWSAADETAFGAIALPKIYQINSARWRHIWRRYGPNEGYAFTVKAESDSDQKSINYVTTENGEVIVGSGSIGLTSAMTFRILPDIPIYEGWRYDVQPPVRFDGNTDYLPPSRLPPVAMYEADSKTDGSFAWLPLSFAGFQIQTDDFGFLIYNAIEETSGVRLLSDPAKVAAGVFKPLSYLNIKGVTTTSGLDLNKLNTVVGVELGSRVSMIKTDYGNVADAYNETGRRLVFTVNGLHLWLGAPGAIWELDPARAGQEDGKWLPGLKFPADQIAYVIRDDRNELSFIAALMWEYFGNLHNPGTWSLKDCGLMSGFLIDNGDTVQYPKLGWMVGKVTYTGLQGSETSVDLNTNVTSIHYDHERGETVWRTDFVSYDGNLQ